MGAEKTVPLQAYKRTKIIATVGPSTDSFEAIKRLLLAGADGLRLNFDYGSYEERTRQIGWIRRASRELDIPVAVIQELSGPKMRLGEFDGFINIQKGQTYRFGYKTDWATSGILPTQHDLSKYVKRGDEFCLYDGKIHAQVTSVRDGVVYVQADNDGVLIQRKSINLPDTDFLGDIITEKDRRDLSFGSEHDIDYVAVGMVQTATDISLLAKLMKNLASDAKIIAKIETRAATENISEIIQVSDAVLVARDNLAIEVLPEAVPILQRQIIGLGLSYAKPTIVSANLLCGLADTPKPTSSEVSDVAAAVIAGADCIMLGDETATGKYPIEAVEVLKRIVRCTQAYTPEIKSPFTGPESQAKRAVISSTIINLAQALQAAAIVAETKSGATVLQIASHRSDIPLIAVTAERRVAQQLVIVYGVKSYVRTLSKLVITKLTDWLRLSKILAKGDIVVSVSGKQPGVVGATDTIKVRQID